MDRRAFNQSILAAGFVAGLPSSVLAAGMKSATRITADINAVTRTGGETTVTKAALKDFQASLRGPLMMPGNANYESARKVWNGMIDKHPAMIARCTGSADVMRAVDFARDNDLLVAVRGGGHSISGKGVCDGGLVIDLTALRGCRVDPETKTARLAGGSLLGDLDHESQVFGLATTAGTVSHTGAGGLTLGGGHGRLARSLGLTCDNVLSVDIVTPDGKLRRASADENSDLYWGVRGGGGNFGVVTSFEYQLHPVGPMVYGGTLTYPIANAAELLPFYADFIEDAPNQLAVDVIMLSPPGGKGFVGLSVCYNGDLQKGEKALEPLRKFMKPAIDHAGPISYEALQVTADASTPPGRQYYNKSGLMNKLEEGAIDALVERLVSTRNPADPAVASNVIVQHLGGAMGEVRPDETAYVHRDAKHDLLILSAWDNPEYEEQNVAWLREGFEAIEPYTIGSYSNHIVDSDTNKEERAFRGNYKRLVKLKNKYDPDNLFHLNANVKPTI
jgi:FAD/FMN-containing dehydrogenase